MKKPDLSFEDFDYDKAKALLPEGYKPIPYISFTTPKPEKVLKVSGFPNEIIAQRRMRELMSKYPSDKYKVIPNQIQVSAKDYALIIPESAQKYLRKEETVVSENPPLVSLTNYTPLLYRFFDKKKYETAFFEKGELLISTFKRCKTDEIRDRQDTHENQNKFVIRDGEHTIETVIGFDYDTLLLCTSLSQINTKKDGTPYEYGFKINNADAFYDILTRALITKGIKICEVLRGPCVYNDKLITLDATGSGLADTFLDSTKKGMLAFAPMMQFISKQAQLHILMNKPTRFSTENEYRHVWLLAHPIRDEDISGDVSINADGSIIVRVPELVAFCERL